MSAWPSQSRRTPRWLAEAGAAGGSLPLLGFLAVTLLVRVLTDDRSAADSRHSGSVNLSGAIAALFILLAAWMLLSRRRGIRPTLAAVAWLSLWSAVAVATQGLSAETLREGIREGSVVALAVITFNSRGAVTVTVAARLAQLAGAIPALIAIYQLAADTGMNVAGELRANGTFAHPNSAVMFFAIAATASMWLYLDGPRRRLDLGLSVIFAAAVVATVSIDGLLTQVLMLLALGALRPGPLAAKALPWLLAGAVLIAFFASPLGAHRVSGESIAAEGRGANSSISWRLKKWKSLMPRWEARPVFGQGLGTTVTEEAIPGDSFAGEPPHNEYVRYLVETGVVGLAALLAGVGVLGRALLRRRGLPGGADQRAAAGLAIVVAAGCLVNALGDNTFLNTPTCYAAALIVIAALTRPVAGTLGGNDGLSADFRRPAAGLQ